MKKGMAVVSAFAMAAVMCAGFTACGADSEAEKIVSDKVTQAEWETAFEEENFGNCKVVFILSAEGKRNKGTETGTKSKVRESLSDDGELDFTDGLNPAPPSSGEGTIISIFDGLEDDEYKLTYTNTLIQDGEKFYIKTVKEAKGFNKEFLEKYTVQGGEVYYVDGSVYAGDKKEVFENYSSIWDVVPLEARNYYEYFEYSEKAKGYVCKQDAPLSEEWKGGTLKFKDGKLAAFLISMTETNDDGTESGTQQMVLTYGGQTITLP